MTFNTAQEAVFISGATELYEVDFGDHVEYYTIMPRTVSFDSGGGANDYLPLPISRGEIRRSAEVGPDELDIALPLNSSMVQYLSEGAHDMITVRIIRGFGDPEISPGNYKAFWFAGLVDNIKYTRQVLQAKLRSIEGLIFDTELPRVRATPGCNNALYGSVCGLDSTLFEQSFTVVEIQRAGTRLRLQPLDPPNSHFDEPDIDNGDGTITPGWYTLGRVWETSYPGGVRHIVGHQWISPQLVCYIEVHAPLPDLAVSDTVVLIPGCDKKRTTCEAKFNNFDNLVAFHRAPGLNPAKHGFTSFYT